MLGLHPRDTVRTSHACLVSISFDLGEAKGGFEEIVGRTALPFQDVWNLQYARASNCMKHTEMLAREAHRLPCPASGDVTSSHVALVKFMIYTI